MTPQMIMSIGLAVEPIDVIAVSVLILAVVAIIGGIVLKRKLRNRKARAIWEPLAKELGMEMTFCPPMTKDPIAAFKLDGLPGTISIRELPSNQTHVVVALRKPQAVPLGFYPHGTSYMIRFGHINYTLAHDDVLDSICRFYADPEERLEEALTPGLRELLIEHRQLFSEAMLSMHQRKVDVRLHGFVADKATLVEMIQVAVKASQLQR